MPGGEAPVPLDDSRGDAEPQRKGRSAPLASRRRRVHQSERRTPCQAEDAAAAGAPARRNKVTRGELASSAIAPSSARREVWARAKSSDLPSPGEPTPPKRLRRLEAGFAKAGSPHVQRDAIRWDDRSLGELRRWLRMKKVDSQNTKFNAIAFCVRSPTGNGRTTRPIAPYRRTAGGRFAD